MNLLRQDGKRDSRQIDITPHDGGGGGVRAGQAQGRRFKGDGKNCNAWAETDRLMVFGEGIMACEWW